VSNTPRRKALIIPISVSANGLRDSSIYCVEIAREMRKHGGERAYSSVG
jgi:hypothetical protein